MAVIGSIDAGGALRTTLEVDLSVLLAKADADGAPLGFEVRSDELAPKFEPGDVIYFGRPETTKMPDLIGRFAGCRLASGETVLARLEQGQEVVWAAPILAWIPCRASARGNA